MCGMLHIPIVTSPCISGTSKLSKPNKLDSHVDWFPTEVILEAGC